MKKEKLQKSFKKKKSTKIQKIIKKNQIQKKKTKANPQKNIHRGQNTQLINKDDKFFPLSSGKGLKFYGKILTESLAQNDQNNNFTPLNSLMIVLLQVDKDLLLQMII